MIRKYTSGGVVEKSKFWVAEQTKPRKKKTGVSSTRKQDENDRSAVKRMARMINCNFAHGDFWITLNYDAAGFEKLGGGDADTLKAVADHMLDLWLRRCRRKLGGEFLYIAGTSDIDGATGEMARPHHHILIPAWAFTVCFAEWKLGGTDVQHLRDQDDYTPVATYFCRQCRRVANENRWKSSRNLKKPIIAEEICTARGPLRAAPGARVMDLGKYCEESGNHYIRYIPKKREKRGGRKQAGTSEGGAAGGF